MHALVSAGKGKFGSCFSLVPRPLCPDEFKQPVEAILNTTFPPDRDPLGDADAEIHFRLTAEDWETHKETLTRLARAVYEAHQAHAAK